MPTDPISEVDLLLAQWAGGERTALDRLIPLVYAELREIAHRHRARWSGHNTVSTTVLVHETYLKLSQGGSGHGTHRSHFLAVASRAMRQLLIDYARARQTEKRGGAVEHVSLEAAHLLGGGPSFSESTADVLVALDESLDRLEVEHEREARVIECRFFGDMTSEETAEALGISLSTVKRAWIHARQWLQEDIAVRSRVSIDPASLQSMLSEEGMPQDQLPVPAEIAVPGYRIERRIGGGVCEVYRAIELATGTAVALKIAGATPGGWTTEDVHRRLELEGDALVRLRHPAVARLRSRGRTPAGSPFLALELLEGESLRDRLKRGPLPEAELAEGGAALAEALAEAHALGVVHRDLKPANVYCASRPLLRLFDFGAARHEGVVQTAAGVTVGTLEYMSPEQLTGSDVGPASDIFSLGVLLLEALGCHPFRHPTMRETVQAIRAGAPILVPEGRTGEEALRLRRALSECLAVDPAARPRAGDVARRLGRAV
ncbi:MAG: ECF-type sigma factor [Gemmatimonadota bacterium]